MNTSPVSDLTFKDEVLECEQPVIVDFYADWCGPCKMLAPVLEELAGEYNDIKIVKLNIDEAGDTANSYDVRSIPTVILFKNGEVQSQIVGFRSKEALISELGL